MTKTHWNLMRRMVIAAVMIEMINCPAGAQMGREEPIIKNNQPDVKQTAKVNITHLQDAMQQGNVPLIVTIENVTNNYVIFHRWPPSDGIVIYMFNSFRPE